MKLKKGKTVKLGTVLLIGFNILIVLSLISVSLVWYSHDRKELNMRIEFIKEQSLKDSKNYLVEKVNQFIGVVDFLREGHKSLSEEELKKIVLQYATTQHFKNGGYIFINTLDGQALVFDGQIVKGYKDVSDMTDKNGKKLFDIEKEAYRNSEGSFMEYYFAPMNSDVPEPKLSYMKGYSDWKWIIGAGFYLQNPEAAISEVIQTHEDTHKKDLVKVISINIIVLILSFLAILHINKRLKMEVGYFLSFFKAKGKEEKFLDNEKFMFGEFNSISDSLNNMILEKEGLSNEIKEREEFLTAIYEAAIHVAIVGLQYKEEKLVVDFFSPGAERILGYKKNEIVGKEIKELFVEEKSDILERIKTLTLVKKKDFRGETYFRRKNGKEFPALFGFYPVVIDGEIAGTVGVATDISERKKAEKAIKESEERFKTFFEEDQSIKIVVDVADGKILDANSAAKSFYGYPDLISKSIYEINMFSSNEVEQEMKLAAFKNKNYFQFKHKVASGEVKDVEVYSSPITIDGNDVLISIIHDISDRVKMEGELEQYKINLENLVKERTQELEKANMDLKDKNKELEKFHDLFISREFRIKELKEELAKIKKQQ